MIGIGVEDLCFSYGPRPILSHINHHFPQGKITALVGHNGCGKSTLVKNILGYLKPSQGRVHFPSHEKIKDISKIVSFVPQNAPLDRSASVYDSVLMGRLPHLESRWSGFSRKDHDKVENVLNRLGLEELAERSGSNLSGGERQKILLARCLVQETPIILLDEATANMDIHHTVEMMELIGHLSREQGVTVITVLHDLNLAVSYCDELLLMSRGKICCAGTAEEVITTENISLAYGASLEVRFDEEGLPYLLPGRGRVKRKQLCI
ncbi:MAG: ABC transporter ATP-binding protein [Spirochaetales bacterium]|nr:ABC transporter ATP-binding protein [Spirochaetales bacterium]